jgi:hypothetical protein
VTYDKVSKPYLTAFGSPDLIFEFEVEDKKYIQWYYYKADIIVEFVCSKSNLKNSWKLSFEINMDPLKHYKIKK